MLAIVAGQGRLPALLVEGCEDVPLIAALEGFAPDDLNADVTFCIEQLGSFIRELGERGVDEICFAGAIRRPPLDPSKVDAATMPLVPRMMAALQAGDDAALRIVLSFFDEAGVTIRAAQEILPELLPNSGVLGPGEPTERQEEDAARGMRVIAALGAGDLGQACVIHKGQALALEAGFGTDWMLDTLQSRPDEGGGLLCKAPKPDQDRRIDLPAIGPETVSRAKSAGLDGIVIEAGGVMILDLDETREVLENTGLFLWVREPVT